MIHDAVHPVALRDEPPVERAEVVELEAQPPLQPLAAPGVLDHP